MKTICLYFEIHQIVHLKRYRFFDIGTDHYYFDDYANESSINHIAANSYIPALKTLIEMARDSKGYFKVALSLSGVGMEQLEQYAPTVIDLLKELNDTGSCEFIAEPYSHGLSSLAENWEEGFRKDVSMQCDKIYELFGKRPTVFRNSSLLYDDNIGAMVAGMGFKGVLTEGAKHILGWKSPHYLYHCCLNPDLKILLRDYKLSDDICLRFSDKSWASYPLMGDTYMNWIADTPEDEEIINIFMNLSSIGIDQPLSSNILEFLKALPEEAEKRGVTFSTPSEVIAAHESVAPLEVPYPMSWMDEERDMNCWLGNVMQREAFEKLYSIGDRVRLCTDRHIRQDWNYLQASNNFRFMSTRTNTVKMDRSIYESAYDAFTNYMNILADFINRVHWTMPADLDLEELNAFQTTIRNQDKKIQTLEKQIARLKVANDDSKKKKSKVKIVRSKE